MEFKNLERAIDVIAKLRDPENGCPWDLKQNHQTLLKYLIEESYEFIQATEEEESKKMEEELGDVLLQVLLHAQIASETKTFDIDSVAKVLADKMIYRHPHVFENKDLAKNADEVRENWEKLKQKESPKKYLINMDDIYAPSLSAAHKIGAKSQAVNFDWDHIDDVYKKVEEELKEVKFELDHQGPKEKLNEEIGDLLFSVAQLARHLDLDPEASLKAANKKFVARINQVEDLVLADEKAMQELSTDELEEYWVKVKRSNK